MTSQKNHRTFEPFAQRHFDMRVNVMLTYGALLVCPIFQNELYSMLDIFGVCGFRLCNLKVGCP